MEKNQVFEAECTGYSSDGEGVTRLDGRVVFVKGLLANERAIVKIIKVGNSVSYGRIERLEVVSPHRREPDCPVFGKCGGCALRHMDYEEELCFKKRKVNDALHRIGGLDLCVTEIIGAESRDGYRNKTIYTVDRIAGRAVTGFYRARSHDLIPAPDCKIESLYARESASVLRSVMDKRNIPAFSENSQGIRRFFCRTGWHTGEGQLVIVTGEGAAAYLPELTKALSAVPGTVSILRNINGAPGDTVLGREYRLLWGKETIEDELCGLHFQLAADAFYQVNPASAEKLYGKTVELAMLDGTQSVLDLYCGAGTITQCLARVASQAVGVESVSSAVESARLTARRNGIENVRFICSDAAEASRTLLLEGFHPDVVVTDPPRKGLSPDTLSLIVSMAPERIVYVSCDPATLARDLHLFVQLGYTPKKAVAVDMFPGTVHVETVVMLSHKKTTA